MDGVSSHLPILKKIIDDNNFNRVIEFGSGFNSTVLFAERIPNGVTIEMQSKEWYEKVKERLPGWDIRLMLGEKYGISFYRNTCKGIFDLMFVDGHGLTRWDCINSGFEKDIGFIIAHDTQESSYGWSKIEKPKEYNIYSYKHNSGIGTTIFTKKDMSGLSFDEHKSYQFDWEKKYV
jgi:hypothetical protein